MRSSRLARSLGITTFITTGSLECGLTRACSRRAGRARTVGLCGRQLGRPQLRRQSLATVSKVKSSRACARGATGCRCAPWR
jgi:hypothetical protein